MSEGINPLEHAHYKSEELEKARQLLDDAKVSWMRRRKYFVALCTTKMNAMKNARH